MLKPNLIILSTKKDLDLLKISSQYIRENIECKKIIVITTLDAKEDVQSIDSCTFFNENDVYEGLNIESVRAVLNDVAPSLKNGGGASWLVSTAAFKAFLGL